MAHTTRPADSGPVYPFPKKRFKVTVISVWREFYFVTAGTTEEALEEAGLDTVDAAYAELEHEFPTIAEPTTEYAPTLEDVLSGRVSQ